MKSAAAAEQARKKQKTGADPTSAPPVAPPGAPLFTSPVTPTAAKPVWQQLQEKDIGKQRGVATVLMRRAGHEDACFKCTAEDLKTYSAKLQDQIELQIQVTVRAIQANDWVAFRWVSTAQPQFVVMRGPDGRDVKMDIQKYLLTDECTPEEEYCTQKTPDDEYK